MKKQLDPKDQQGFVIVDVFSPEECTKIIRYMKKNYPLVTAEISGGGKSRLNTDLKSRSSEVSWLPNTDKKAWWFKDRMKEHMLEVNKVKYQFDISWAQKIQFTRYACDEFYSWHCDKGVGHPSNKRKLSMTCLLSDPSKYTGGELVLLIHGSNYHTLELKQGQAVIFTSTTPHMVTPVEPLPGTK